jgi:hypothetical protein
MFTGICLDLGQNLTGRTIFLGSLSRLFWHAVCLFGQASEKLRGSG